MWSLGKLKKQCQSLLPLLYQVHCCAFKGKNKFQLNLCESLLWTK
jgi:hypothetical protein